jgi:hypothetical protein
MGQNPSQLMQFAPQHAMMQQMSCQDDLECQHIDEKRSTVDHLVLDCPEAKCMGGTCSCGSKCSRDPYMGVCCNKVEKKVVNGQLTTFCIENPYIHTNIPTPLPRPTGTSMPTLMHTMSPINAASAMCKVPDQHVNGVTITGQQICDLYNRFHHN